MGEVIEFQPRVRTERTRLAAIPAVDAQILFFTGVRYERHIDDPEPRVPAKRGTKDGAKRRRKRVSG